MKLVVQKYGGSSVADPEKINLIAEKIAGRISLGEKVIAVVSAMGKTTDSLIRLAKHISSSPDSRELDMLLATGEQVTASLLSMALIEKGVKAKSLNAFQAGIKTTDNFQEAKIESFDTERIMNHLKKFNALVITGFQGITHKGDITTLGRGGSDTSAVALAAALKIGCEIYSDVPGIFTIDPRLIPTAKKLKYVHYDEMLDMTSLGAKILHNRSVEIAKKFNIKIYCGSTFSDEEGSYVVNEELIIEQPLVTGASITENEMLVKIKNLPVDYSLVTKIFEKVAKGGLNVDMIPIINTEDALVLSFTIIEEKRRHFESIISKIKKEFSNLKIEYHTGFVKLSVVGIGMRSGIGVAYSFFKALQNIPIQLVTTSEIKISCLIEADYKQRAIEAVSKEFKLAD
jgi:aspartate kinase